MNKKLDKRIKELYNDIDFNIDDMIEEVEKEKNNEYWSDNEIIEGNAEFIVEVAKALKEKINQLQELKRIKNNYYKEG